MPLFSPFLSSPNTTVELRKGFVRKNVSGFGHYVPSQQLANVRRAYALGNADSKHYLVGSKRPPTSVRGSYHVDVQPVGVASTPNTEQVTASATSMSCIILCYTVIFTAWQYMRLTRACMAGC